MWNFSVFIFSACSYCAEFCSVSRLSPWLCAVRACSKFGGGKSVIWEAPSVFDSFIAGSLGGTKLSRPEAEFGVCEELRKWFFVSGGPDILAIGLRLGRVANQSMADITNTKPNKSPIFKSFCIFSILIKYRASSIEHPESGEITYPFPSFSLILSTISVQLLQ